MSRHSILRLLLSRLFPATLTGIAALVLVTHESFAQARHTLEIPNGPARCECGGNGIWENIPRSLTIHQRSKPWKRRAAR